MGATAPIFTECTQRRQSAGVKTPTWIDLEMDRDFPGPCEPLPMEETQFDPDPYTDVNQDRRGRPQPGHGRPELIWSPDAALMNTVARLQLDLDEMRAESRCLRTLGGRDSLSQPRQVTFMSTKVPKFDVTSWEQYRQVFDAIVQSNGWDDATAALQLFSHLEGDALNVALLVPESR